MKFKEVAKLVNDCGYQVLPCAGKRPVIEEWQNVDITSEMVVAWAANGKGLLNTGIRTGVGANAVYGFDCDIYEPKVAKRIRESFWSAMGDGPLRLGQRPKSLTLYAGEPGHAKMQAVFTDPNGTEHKVELLGAGQQFIAFGRHPDTGLDYEWPNGQSPANTETWELNMLKFDKVSEWFINELPRVVPQDWKIKTISAGTAGSVSNGTTDGSVDVLDQIRQRADVTDDEVKTYLDCLPEDVEYDEWMQIMFGVHHQYNGSEEGFVLFNEYSRRSKKHVEATTRYKWDKIKDAPRQNTVTFATVIHKARQTEAWSAKQIEVSREVADGWKEKIEGCTDADELELICGQVGLDSSLSVIGKAKIEQAIIGKFKAMNVKITKTDVARMFSEAKRKDKSGGINKTQRDQRNAWSAQYVWLNFEDAFVNTETQEVISVQSFNAKHGRDVKGIWMTADGYQMKAAEVALQEIQIPTLSRRMYLPSADEQFSIDGLEYLNLYRKLSVPTAKLEDEWDDADRAAVEAIRSHVKTVCTDAAEYMIWWMAHNTQFPGLKIRHAPLIKGIEGDGKSVFHRIMSQVIGRENVKAVSPKVLLTDFNGWAEGSCIAFFEEIRIPGHNRYDAANAIKPLITNDIVPIHRKGKDEYNIVNTTNYAAFTNYADALPLTDTDRRWTVIFSPFYSIQHMNEQLGEDYFDRLFNAIDNHSAAIRGWLLSEDLSKFDRNGRAMMTVAKESMVSAARNELEEAILEIIESGAPGVSKTVVSTKHLATAIAMTETDIAIHTSGFVAPLTRLGYVRVPRQIRWQGSPIRVWVRGLDLVTSNEKVRVELDATNPSESNEDDLPIPF